MCSLKHPLGYFSSLSLLFSYPFPLIHSSLNPPQSLSTSNCCTSSVLSSFHPPLLSPSSKYYLCSVPHPGYSTNHLTTPVLPATLLTSAQGELQEYGGYSM